MLMSSSLSTLAPNPLLLSFFFFNHPPTTEIYTLSLHDALPISHHRFATRRHHAPQGAVFASHRCRAARCLDPQPLDEAPVAVVVFRMRDHREAERVGDVAKAQLDLEPREVTRADAQRVFHHRLRGRGAV